MYTKQCPNQYLYFQLYNIFFFSERKHSTENKQDAGGERSKMAELIKTVPASIHEPIKITTKLKNNQPGESTEV